jgi:hypothetical protein
MFSALCAFLHHSWSILLFIFFKLTPELSGVFSKVPQIPYAETAAHKPVRIGLGLHLVFQ